MKFLALDRHAVKEIISIRTLQSADYFEGNSLVKFLKGECDFNLDNKLKGVKQGQGMFLFSREKDPDRLLVFDLGEFKGFQKTPQEIISIIQKTCRLAIKLWNKIGFSPCERLIYGTTYIALLPLQFNPGKSYKVLLDKSPDAKRQETRGDQHFLVFADCYGNTELVPKMAPLREAEKEFHNIKIEDYYEIYDGQESDFDYIQIVDIGKNGNSNQSPLMGMEFWRNNLTDTQKKFVFNDRLGPDVLKGAAGTGKTLSLALRAINNLCNASDNNREMKSAFITHSIATKNYIETLVSANGGSAFLNGELRQKIHVTTLQEWCLDNLGAKIATTEYLDKDALESKNTQLLYISEAYDDFLINDFESSKNFISDELVFFLENNDPWTISVYLQNEISTYIKGRADQEFNSYKKLQRSSNSIPLVKEEDFSTIFHIFNNYQSKLEDLNLFDSDDITVTALQETSTPIWKRRKKTEGYDVLYIDETHLFNVNELSLFHNLLKKDSTSIIFTIDRTQATGDSSIAASDVAEAIHIKGMSHDNYGFETVFRCSNQIISLGGCILASGATLFSQLENPLSTVTGGFTVQEEARCSTPYLVEVSGENNVISETFLQVNELSKKLQISKSQVLIVPSCDEMVSLIKNYQSKNNIEVSYIENRGDYSVVDSAKENNAYLVGAMDYIGGLEFPAVVIVGMDKEKFPPKSSRTNEANHFIKYSSYNRLYVAITRAKYAVAFISDKSFGVSETLSNAIEEELISLVRS